MQSLPRDLGPKVTASTPDWVSVLFIGLALAIGIIAGLGAKYVSSPVQIIVAIGGLLATLGVILRIRWGLVIFVFVTYVNLSDVAIKYHNASSLAQPLVALLVLAIFARWRLYGERPANWQRPALLFGLYGLAGFISLFSAGNFSRAQEAMIDYVKDILVALIIVTLVQKDKFLHRVIWGLLIAGIFMGTISVYQQLTGTFDNEYYGFGRTQALTSGVDAIRISGPLADPNAYAQLMVMLVPLALERLWNEKKRITRVFAAWAFGVCGLTVIFTFSRGAFLALIVALGLMLIRRPPRLTTLLITLAITVPVLQFIPSNYSDRIEAMFADIPLFGADSVNDNSFRGRLSENTVAWMMFNEHPFLGVGLKNYPTEYLKYSQLLGIDPRRQDRSPHNFYLEIAAETGLLGLATFGLVMWYVLRGFRQAQIDMIAAGKPEYASLIWAYTAGLMGYLTAAIFLHNAYPRFFWLLIGLALAMPIMAKYELKVSQETNQLGVGA